MVSCRHSFLTCSPTGYARIPFVKDGVPPSRRIVAAPDNRALSPRRELFQRRLGVQLLDLRLPLAQQGESDRDDLEGLGDLVR